MLNETAVSRPVFCRAVFERLNPTGPFWVVISTDRRNTLSQEANPGFVDPCDRAVEISKALHRPAGGQQYNSTRAL
jgi:hypothetical protein